MDESPQSYVPASGTTGATGKYEPYMRSRAQGSQQASGGQPAGFWIRFAAYLMDGVILLLFYFILIVALTDDGITSGSEIETTTADIIYFITSILYFSIGVAAWATTLGKRVLRLYVVRTNGAKVGFGRALARYFAYTVSLLTLGIGFIMIGIRDDRRGLHDLICDTMVVIKK